MAVSPIWRIVSASAVGTSHQATGAPCQDSHASVLLNSQDGEVLVAVVCDGAGTAKSSDRGSWLAANIFVELVEIYFKDGAPLRALDRSQVAQWIEQVGCELDRDATANDLVPRDYACTLVAAIIGESDAAFIQIGDGAIVVSHGMEDGWSYVFWPQHGEYANTTNFVVSHNVLDVFEFELASRKIEEIAIFSDGIEKLVLHDATRTVHDDFFNKMLPPVRDLKLNHLELCLGLRRYLESPVICDRTDDDKTLILATRNSILA